MSILSFSRNGSKVVIFYDGDCGLCNFFVRFVLLNIRRNNLFLFASQKGKSFNELKIHFKHHNNFPDSIFVFDEKNQKLLIRTKAIIYILDRLKPPWYFVGKILKLIPVFILDFFYFIVSKIRNKFFKKVISGCPLLPSEMKNYFIN